MIILLWQGGGGTPPTPSPAIGLPSAVVEIGRLDGWQLDISGSSELGTTTDLATLAWTDITNRVLGFNVRRGRQHELDRMEAGVASIQLMNQDGAFNPTNTSSTFYPFIRPMTPIRISARWTQPFNANDISGLVAWYDFSAVGSLYQDAARTTQVTADGQVIKGVADQGLNAYHLSEVTNGPTYKTGIKNGKSIARFDGTNDVLQGPTATETQPTTVIAVAVSDVTDAVNRQIIATENASTSSMGKDAGSPSKFNLWNGSNLAMSANADTNWHIHVGVSNTTSSKRYVDGGTPATGDTGTNAWSNWTIGSYADLSQFWDGDIGEVLMYNSALGAADLNMIGAYLADKWGITWNTVS